MESVVNLPIVVPTGPELVAGSTRLKAGTAQKVVLNLISTAAMIALGKVYEGLMVEVKATNEKLRKRAERIVARLHGGATRAGEGGIGRGGVAGEADDSNA